MDNAIQDALKMLCDTGNADAVDDGFARPISLQISLALTTCNTRFIHI